MADIISTRPAVGFLEVHSENYITGSPAASVLDRLRTDYPISLHGVGLSLGTSGRLDRRHLTRLRALADRIEPALVSEHLSWSGLPGVFLNELLPLPYTEEALQIVCDHIDETQEVLGRRLLIENPAVYLRFRHSVLEESEFLTEVVRRTSCHILLDLNNLYVNSVNFNFDAQKYLAALPRAIGEIHLAGHHIVSDVATELLIDDHGSQVAEAVWNLYRLALDRFGPAPTLIEWDTRIPELSVLLNEARQADRIAATKCAIGGEDVIA